MTRAIQSLYRVKGRGFIHSILAGEATLGQIYRGVTATSAPSSVPTASFVLSYTIGLASRSSHQRSPL